MRLPRLKLPGEDAVYHCIARVVGGEFLLGDSEKERLRIMIRQNADFAGVEILAHCIMSNHFHVLVRVPADRTVSDAELLRRVRAYYPKKSPSRLVVEESMESDGLPCSIRERITERMGDVSAFMKELKQGYPRWHNKLHGRFGTLWAERFKSLIVENSPSSIAAVAAYIDLNPVRAGLVTDPKDYRWSGYAEAVAGYRQAQRGIIAFMEGKKWKAAGAQYRQMLFVKSGVTGRSSKRTLDRETIKKAVEEGGDLTLAEVLRLRVRYFSDGVALGSRAFVDSVRAEFRDHFGAKRRTGAHPIGKGDVIPGMYAMRDLRGDRFT